MNSREKCTMMTINAEKDMAMSNKNMSNIEKNSVNMNNEENASATMKNRKITGIKTVKTIKTIWYKMIAAVLMLSILMQSITINISINASESLLDRQFKKTVNVGKAKLYQGENCCNIW